MTTPYRPLPPDRPLVPSPSRWPSRLALGAAVHFALYVAWLCGDVAQEYPPLGFALFAVLLGATWGALGEWGQS